MSAETHVSNGGAAWTADGLAAALGEVDRQDRAFMIAPGLHVRAGAPSQAALDALDAVGRGEAAMPAWKPINLR